MKGVRSGDTLIDELDTESRSLQFVGMNIPPPVFFCSIEPQQSQYKTELF